MLTDTRKTQNALAMRTTPHILIPGNRPLADGTVALEWRATHHVSANYAAHYFPFGLGLVGVGGAKMPGFCVGGRFS